jgi:hypothetical protein
MLDVIDHALERLALKWTADIQYLTGYWRSLSLHTFKTNFSFLELDESPPTLKH